MQEPNDIIIYFNGLKSELNTICFEDSDPNEKIQQFIIIKDNTFNLSLYFNSF